MDHTEEQRIISFCTGYGGIERGIERAGVNVRTVAACEIETYAIANLVDKMEKGELQPFPIWTDLKTFDGKPFCDKVHGIIAGYPCQPFSQAGKRQGVEDPRHLWPYICSNIKTIKPIWAFFENVSGHLTMGFDEVCRSLWDMGYNVEAGMFTASEVGAPHQRKRLFILAHAIGVRSGHKHGILKTDISSGSGASGELADTRVAELNRLSEPKRRVKSLSVGQPSARSELADTESVGRQWVQSKQNRQGESGNNGEGENATEGSCQLWPSRPGQPQQEWEAPRTTESRLGRAVNGAAATMDANRVDRLRLLGNGVVPQTVELAWVKLWDKMLKGKS